VASLTDTLVLPRLVEDPPLKPGCTELKLADATRLSVLPPSLNSITRPPQETPPASNGDLAVFKKRSVEPASPQTLMAVENLLVRLEKRYPKVRFLFIVRPAFL
jgi:hypothetical protein